MSTAWLFPGQGSQYVGMGKDVLAVSSAARAVFERVDAALGEPLSKLILEGPEADLTITANAQPAIVAMSCAVLAALRERKPDLPLPAFAAGHSLGEYSALVAADALALEDAVRLVRARGRAMQEAVPQGAGAMAAIIGMDQNRLLELCAQVAQVEGGRDSTVGRMPEGTGRNETVGRMPEGTGRNETVARNITVVSPANFNAPGQIVIAGHARAVARVGELAAAEKARVIPLKVSAPFHCALMAPAARVLGGELERIVIRPLRFPVVANFDARPNADPTRVRSLLVRQVDGVVRWEDSVRAMAEAGVTRALEIGPGKVLAGLVKRIAKDVAVMSVGDETSLDQVSGFLAGSRL